MWRRLKPIAVSVDRCEAPGCGLPHELLLRKSGYIGFAPHEAKTVLPFEDSDASRSRQISYVCPGTGVVMVTRAILPPRDAFRVTVIS